MHAVLLAPRPLELRGCESRRSTREAVLGYRWLLLRTIRTSMACFRRRRLAWACAAGLGACGGAPSVSPPPPLPAALVLRIDAVDVQPRADGLTWDGPASEGDPGAGCKVLVAGLAVVEPVLSSASVLCGLASATPLERRHEEPDLVVRLGAAADVSYSSWVVRDTSSQALQYEFVVPVAALPADGLRLDVLDDDADQGTELIGSMRLSRDELIRTYQSSSKLLVLSGGAVRRVELVTGPYVDEPATRTARHARDEPIVIGRRVMAGEVLSVHASGSFTVGSWFDRKLDPAGYPGNEARSYNLGPFTKEPHACAVALIGDGRTVDGVPIGADKTFVANHAGRIRVGLNDRDLTNNDGQVSFEVARRAPTVAEWRVGGRPK